ncbi:hypothetical protein M422DRAFT_785348 [Sphaerobolus stellatus SS14]|uniref:Unplaced genomic scaffold SPHSTscaffold_312, whole genome shotgun sequence n=1 Tax=Sphaerobolus stellatus (strain SS14) TaxID=990650 RepID=A0A0C9UAD1_SPHS4|nr:hypothetical protein M422DRAFT_785348 [Sphaerobolus stellatus SS14]
MASSLPSALAKITKNPFSSKLKGAHNLYQTLSLLPKDGVGSLVAQPRWERKGIPGCFFYITRTKLKTGGEHGKAWGILFWKPMEGDVSERKPHKEAQIRGGLKYQWKSIPYEDVGFKGIEEELRLYKLNHPGSVFKIPESIMIEEPSS